MSKLDSLHFDFSAWLTSLTTLAFVLIIGALLSGMTSTSAQARAWAPLDVTWTQSLQDEVKVLGERFTGHHQGERPDWIAAHCGRGANEIGASNCPRR